MRKKRLKKGIAELRSKNQALRKRIEEPDWKEECTKTVKWWKEYRTKNPTSLNQILRQEL